MTIRYKGWLIFEQVINTLVDGSGYTVFSVDIANEIGPATEVKSLWKPGKFLTREIARQTGIAGGVAFIDGM